MHVILTGATGLVGSGVLDAMMKMKDISKISILSRRPVPMAEDAKDARIDVIIHKDFEKYDSELLSKLKGARGCVWALGISQTQVGAEEYVKITKSFALEAAKAFQDLASEEEPFNFVYVSGEGATTKPGIFAQIFARVKGETEVSLAELRKANPSFHTSSVRPGFVDSAAHDAIKSYIPEKSLTMKIAHLLMAGTVGTVFLSSLHSPTEPVGRVMAEIAMGKYRSQLIGKDVERIGDFPILSNKTLRRLAGL
ncbi:putative nucleoside-diphosphate-sugar epimerase [Xylariales sp. AK1849]|nr:putative nucleoside-diphosphate-sugar epimerase [Xylariales sp. AK1849]